MIPFPTLKVDFDSKRAEICMDLKSFVILPTIKEENHTQRKSKIVSTDIK